MHFKKENWKFGNVKVFHPSPYHLIKIINFFDTQIDRLSFHHQKKIFFSFVNANQWNNEKLLSRNKEIKVLLSPPTLPPRRTGKRTGNREDLIPSPLLHFLQNYWIKEKFIHSLINPLNDGNGILLLKLIIRDKYFNGFFSLKLVSS